MNRSPQPWPDPAALRRPLPDPTGLERVQHMVQAIDRLHGLSTRFTDSELWTQVLPQSVACRCLSIVGEAAAALGHAGRKLGKALNALRRYDAEVAAAARRSDAAFRASLVLDAADAFWGYVVQREQFGLLDSDYIAAEYAVPDEVRLVMGPKRSA